MAAKASKLATYLTPGNVILNLTATTKEGAIDELLSALEAQHCLADMAQARADILEREKQMSTGITDGLATPHAKSAGAVDLAVALGFSRAGIDFTALDGKPSHAIFLVISRPERSGPHLQCMAEIAAFYAKPNLREALLAATTVDQVLSILANA